MKTPKTSTFVSRLYSLLEDNTHGDAVEWCQQGDNFVIKDLKMFKARLLSGYFANVNYPSFARQLKMYGFSQVSDARTQRLPNGQRWFRHPEFFKGNKDNLHMIKRVPATRPTPLVSHAVPKLADPVSPLQPLNSPTLSENYSNVQSAFPSSPTEPKACKFCARGMNTAAYLFLHACALSSLPEFSTNLVGPPKSILPTPSPRGMEVTIDLPVLNQHSYNIFPRAISPTQLRYSCDRWD